MGCEPIPYCNTLISTVLCRFIFQTNTKYIQSPNNGCNFLHTAISKANFVSFMCSYLTTTYLIFESLTNQSFRATPLTYIS